MSSETNVNPGEGQSRKEPDPFGQIFNHVGMAKLPRKQLNSLETKLLAKAEELGAPSDEDAKVYFGAAFVTLIQADYSPGSKFFDAMVQRLAEAAEPAKDLAGFLQGLFTGFSCENTDGGYLVKHGGHDTLWKPVVPALHFVETFLAMEALRWQIAEQKRNTDQPEGRASSAPQEREEEDESPQPSRRRMLGRGHATRGMRSGLQKIFMSPLKKARKHMASPTKDIRSVKRKTGHQKRQEEDEGL